MGGDSGSGEVAGSVQAGVASEPTPEVETLSGERGWSADRDGRGEGKAEATVSLLQKWRRQAQQR